MKRHIALSVLITIVLGINAEDNTSLWHGFSHPQDTARTKVWWFFGEGETTREGITADLEAFKQQGVGGVVYYDQVHGDGKGADELMSLKWWQDLIFAATEAKRLGLVFDINIGNGYVAGGKWITPDKAMQRLEVTERLVEGGIAVRTKLPLTRRANFWHSDVAVLAIPYDEALLGDSRLLNAIRTAIPSNVAKGSSQVTFDFGKPFTARSITYESTPHGKARTSSMQVPPTHQPMAQPDPTRFYGCGFRELPSIGVLEVSDDGINYRKVCDLRPRYHSYGGVKQQTIAFSATTGRYFRLRIDSQEKVALEECVVSARACIDEWEEKACQYPELVLSPDTVTYSSREQIPTNGIIDITDKLSADGTLTWNDAPKGRWLLMRFMAVTTGGHTKHGRAKHLGLECDKLSVEGARLHWQNYTKAVIDSLRAHGADIQNVCMDSHEAGPQNWTANMMSDFLRLRGYDMRPYLPTMAAGLIVKDDRPQAGDFRSCTMFLYDLRRTVSDLITTNYYGEFNRLCREEGVTLTAQAIGAALTMTGDNIEVKRLVDKPQGEFWGYQREGSYDIKDCSSAAHVYGKKIASAEAFTDITYKHSLADIKSLADRAYTMGANEFVVCAVAYQSDPTGRRLNTANGRQYVLNRLNTQWTLSRSFWDYQARTTWMLRQGSPVSDLCFYLGDNVPKRIMGHLLPDIPKGYDFDAFTTDVLLHRMSVEKGCIVLPDGISYSMLLLPSDEELTPAAQQKVDELRRAGAHIWNPKDGEPLSDALQKVGITPDVDFAPLHPDALHFCHRRTANEDIYFLENHSNDTIRGTANFKSQHRYAEWWNPVTGQRYALPSLHLALAPRESCFIILSDTPSTAPALPSATEAGTEIPGPWKVKFDASAGGSQQPVVFETLTDWSKHDDEQIRYFSGTAIYTNTFRLKEKEPQSAYHLTFAGVHAAAQVFVNGHDAGTVWCSPWTVDITPYVKKGKNRLEIRVVNSLWNRLVGDANKAETDRIMLQNYPLAKPTDRLVTSGLTEGVKIVKMK